MNNYKIIMAIYFIIISIVNIIFSIQNKNDRKMSFWFLIFGIVQMCTGLGISLEISIVGGKEIFFVIIPIIFAVKNLFFIKKNKATKMQIISYILAIIFAILIFLKLSWDYWNFIAIIMLYIYIYIDKKKI